MLDILIERLHVDLESRAVELVLSLPNWAIQSPQRLGNDMCLKATSARRDGHEAQGAMRLPLVRYRVFWLGRRDGYIGYGIAA